MDRITDGGMAPALQSSNHQSTGITSEEEVNRAGSALIDKKVNGKTYKLDSPSHEITTESSVRDIALHSIDTEASAPDKFNQDTEIDSCVSSGMKEVATEVTMPTLQIGQGDSVLGHIAGYNGWADSKKSVIEGILQESNNLSAVRLGLKTPVTKISTLKDTDSSKNHEISCNGDTENGHLDESPVKSNGHVSNHQMPVKDSHGVPFQDSRERSCKAEGSDMTYFLTESCVPDDGLQQKATNSKMLNDKMQALFPLETSATTLNDESTEIHCALETDNAKCIQNTSVKEERKDKSPISELNYSSRNIPKPSNCENSSDQNNDEQSLTPTQESADSMFLYSQILPSGLTGMNMSDNLTNTLQELAASLKEASFPLQLDVTREMVSRETINTVNSDNVNVNTLHTSAKSLDFSEDDCSKHEAYILDRTNHVTHCAGILENRLALLKQNLLQVRSKILSTHVHNQFVSVASHLPRQDWDSRPVNVVDTDSTPAADMWQRLLENGPEASSKSVFDRINTQDLESRGKKLQLDSDHKTSPDVMEIAGDSNTQPVNHHSRKMLSIAELQELAQDKAGILKKELRYAKSCCDPDMTESSSDEDFEEAYEDVSRKTKTSTKASAKPRITKYRKSFCKWMAERAEISRKWTWLQSRIAGMEFEIRNQGDLYNQLRSNKGMVRLVPGGSENSDGVERSTIHMDIVHDRIYTADTQASSSSPPCSINHVLDNVNHQASRLMDKLSPVSGGWPSPLQEMTTSESRATVTNVQLAVPMCHDVSSLEGQDECARTTALDRSLFKTRKLVRINQKCLDRINSLKPATVPNDSSIMRPEKRGSAPRQVENYSSLILKAAVHDHSYHATISSLNDIPLSVSIQAVMKSKHKWSKKSDSSKKDKTKKTNKKVKKSEKKLRRSLDGKHLEEVVERKRRRLTSQLSEVSSRKRTAGSMDSDFDSQVVIGGISTHQFGQGSASGASTPAAEMFASGQNPWKKKKAMEQTFDINNIVIPHGLNTPRIEKLVYKEIQTPSWKFLNVKSLEDTPHENVDKISATNLEDTSDTIFQTRHENYEISEKKKFMSLVQSRRSWRGFRNSTLREPTTQDPASPIPASGDSETHSRVADALVNMTSSQPISAVSPTAKPGTVRRLSGDHFVREHRPISPLALPPSQRNLDNSYSACPSPSLCQSDAGSRRNSHDNPAYVTRTSSYNSNKVDEPACDGWEIRSFPLSEEELKLLDDIEHAKSLLGGGGHNGTMYRSLDGDDSGRHTNNRAQNFEKYYQDYTKFGLADAHRDTVKSTARRRTDSRASSLASFDDSARHSDASSTSVSSSRRKKKGWHCKSEVLSHRNGNAGGKGSKKVTSRKSKHKYIHVRLSETDDSSTDSEGDSTDSLYTSDDAGHLIDDFADPEWEAPRHRERR